MPKLSKLVCVYWPCRNVWHSYQAFSSSSNSCNWLFQSHLDKGGLMVWAQIRLSASYETLSSAKDEKCTTHCGALIYYTVCTVQLFNAGHQTVHTGM